MGISVGYDDMMGSSSKKTLCLFRYWEMDENGPFIEHFDDLPMKNGDSL